MNLERICLDKVLTGAKVVFAKSSNICLLQFGNFLPSSVGYINPNTYLLNFIFSVCFVHKICNVQVLNFVGSHADGDFRDLVNKIPSGVTFTFISDSCHSGGLIDSEKEQIGGGVIQYATTPSTGPAASSSNPQAPVSNPELQHNNSTGQGNNAEGGLMGLISRGLQAFHIPGDDEAPPETQPQTQTIEFESQYAADVAASQEDAPQSRNKNLDINTLTEILSQRTGQDVKVGNIRTTIFDVFGDQASSSVKTFVNAIFSHLQVKFYSVLRLN